MIRITQVQAGALALSLAMLGGACGPSDSAGNGVDRADSAPAELAATDTPSSQRALPLFADDGSLIRPEGWQGWVLAGTSMGLTYSERPREFAPGEPPGRFLNVYLQPWAYESFMETGEYPEGTMFILAGSQPVRKADPARGGFYQGDLHLMEVHLKQDGIDSTGWAFFGFGGDDASAEMIPGDADCYSCHSANAAHDQVFSQFYPMIRERLGLADEPDVETAHTP